MMWKTFFNWWDPLGEFGFWVGCTPTLHEFALVAQRPCWFGRNNLFVYYERN